MTDKPYRDIVLNKEDLLDHAIDIAQHHLHQEKHIPKRTLLPRVKENMLFLERAYHEISDYSSRMKEIVPAAEWFLDNYYILKDLKAEIQRSLPKKYERQLPRISSGDLLGYPQIYGVIVELIEHTDSQLQSETLKAFINAYQSVVPLSSGELWAIPIMLRIVLLENIRRLVEQILFTQAERQAAERWVLPFLETEHTPEESERRLNSLEQQDRYSSAYAERLLKRLRDLGAEGVPLLQWVDRVMSKQDATIEDLAKLERQRQAMYQVSMGHAVLSLHFVNAENWPYFYEDVSLVHNVLMKDPSGIFAAMDFESRDAYRHQVEKLARRFKVSELVIARKVLARAQKAQEQGALLASHVGFDLVGEGREDLEQELEKDWGAIRQIWCEIQRRIRQKPAVYYLGFNLLGVGILSIWALSYVLASNMLSIFPLFFASFGILIWASGLIIPTVNGMISRLFRPAFLPKLELREGVPESLRTIVVVPTLLTNVDRVKELIGQLEVYYLANHEPNIYFALLGDFADADTETQDDDHEIIAMATMGIDNLNQKYSDNRFYFFHRKRLYNSAERIWMGWERKRGKLIEFNRLLQQDQTTSYAVQVGDVALLPSFRFVLTLDADTQLPRGSAKKLIGTLAHPMHHARLSQDGKRIEKGYGVLQPRIGVSILSGGTSPFARIFSGKVGIDPYTTAVSDVYQDLFGEGIFTGKGIYDIHAFHHVTNQAFPENAILSHDLIEGIYARAGLVTDVELIDGYPAKYLSYLRRLHRWVRGDWQLIPWLFKPLPFISHWKIFDNLRRSLEAPALLLLFFFAFTVFTGNPWFWVGLAALSLVWPLVLHLLSLYLAKPSNRGNVRHELENGLLQFALQFIFLPYNAIMMFDAIVRSLYRQFISHRRMLEWETAADTEKRLDDRFKTVVMAMWPTYLFILIMGIGIINFFPGRFSAFVPLGILWGASPWVAYRVSLPSRHRKEQLSTSEQEELRRWARKIWAFFDEFVSCEDHWLPPDNVQVEPPNGVAHRTSPTNIGLTLLANLAASDFGYVSHTRMVERIKQTLSTVEGLERWKGHLYNWYDTSRLTPLGPLYVSTVDSGNFVMYLLTLKTGLIEHINKPIIGAHLTQGLKDTYDLLMEAEGREGSPKLTAFGLALESALTTDEAWNLQNWAKLLTLWPSSGLEQQLTPEGEYWTRQLEAMIQSFRGEIETYFPWLSHPSDWEANPFLRPIVFKPLSLSALAKVYTEGLDENAFSPSLKTLIESSLTRILHDIKGIEDVQRRLEALALATNFRPLFDETRQLFSIGYRVEDGLLDQSYYDLLASEARQASFIAIAKGDVPHSHWFRLGRSLTIAKGKRSLVSWSGTMFEFLMPLLVMQNYEGTILDETYRSVVNVQMAYGAEKNVPWGISESGYFTFDAQLNYQYKAFGVPGLGLKRGLVHDLVIAPYATFLALQVFPREALSNMMKMEQLGFAGRYGLYEAIDYTRERIPVGSPFRIIQSFMAHHQGMSFLALNNVLFENAMQHRLHAEALIQSTALLLQERLPEQTRITPQPEGQMSGSDNHLNQLETDKLEFITLDTADSPIPVTHCISNGRYSVMLTNSGAGFSRYQEIGLSRWREDVTRDPWGIFFYIQNLNSGEVWSATHQPCQNSGDNYKVTYAPDRVEFSRKDGNITTRTEVVVSPEDAVEIRRISLTNHSQYDRTIEVTSYFEAVLARPNDDLAHPAFGNLFIQTEFNHNAILASRRPRREDQPRLWLMHTVATEGETEGSLQYESDRGRFIGRGRSLSRPQALDPNQPLSNTVGAVLDPIMSLRQRVKIRPGQTVHVSFSVGYAERREELIRIADKYQDPLSVNRAFELAWTHSQMELHHLNLTAAQANEALSLGGHLLYLSPCRRDAADCIEKNRKGQSALWPYAISGDRPIVLIRVNGAEHLDLVRQLLTIHEYWRLKGLFSDLVILNEDESGYVQTFQDNLRDVIAMGHARDLLNRAGGVFLLQKGHVPPEDVTLLCAVARIIFSGEGGSCSVQVRKKGKLLTENITCPIEEDRITQIQEMIHEDDDALGILPTHNLQFANGYGGFSEDGQAYVIELHNGKNTPLPWINVIANAKFGFQISESGAGYTWSLNSREYKLTPWSNDPILDPFGEVLFLRDEETGVSWSVTPQPKREKGSYTISHGQGYSRFEHFSHGLKQSLLLFVPVDTPVKVIQLTLTNITQQEIHLSTSYYTEWVMGVAREHTAPYIITSYEAARQTIFVRNSYQEEFAGRVGFLALFGTNVTSYTGDRSEFIGRNRDLNDPLGMKLDTLSDIVGAGLDPCSALQSKFTVPPGETKTIYYLLGETENQDAAERMVTAFGKAENVEKAFSEVKQFWDRMLGTVHVETPDPSMNVLLNRWLLYQTVVCRLWARSAFYQSGGAFGFRDQLQDVMALVNTSPERVRDQILRHCAHQFVEGDVQHWWHDEKGKGIRTKFSDDLLWLPYVTAHYLERTGDDDILKASIPFLEDHPLKEDEDERYSIPNISTEQGSVYEHCIRALERGLRFGEHGLPLIGSGDWNDGFSRIGCQGKGESVWLGWFLYLTLMRFAKVCDTQQDPERGTRYRQSAEELQKNMERHGWDGGWYRRAYFDDGTPLGSARNKECQIDAIAQSWSVLSGAAKESRAQDAMLALEHYLWRKDDGLLLLLTPPFDRFQPDPGYIKGYVPGVRENGGQYTHGAIWAIMAFASMGEGDKATELFQTLNPIHHSRTEHEVHRYKVEPYVMAADVYASHPHVGRGGWTWYTGAAGWMYQAGLEGILGFTRHGDQLVLKPCIPSRWTGYRLVYHYHETRYEIIVENPHGKMTGFEQITLDDALLPEPTVSLKDDQQPHTIHLIM